MELGLSSDAAFRRLRPRPSSRLQGRLLYRFERVFGRGFFGLLDPELVEEDDPFRVMLVVADPS
jgi:hypothetical protein